MRLGGSSSRDEKDRKAVLAEARKKRAQRKRDRERLQSALRMQGFMR